MRVLLLNERLYPDFIGGVERRNYDLALALSQRGHQVTLVGFGSGPESVPDGVRFLSLGKLGRLYSGEGKRSTLQAFRFAWRVFRLSLSDYDVVEASNIPYIHLLPLAVQCAVQRKPLLITWYEFWGPYWKKYLGRWRAPMYRVGEWVAARLGTSVIATSQLTAARLARSRRRPDGIPVLPCGIDFQQIETAVAGDSEGTAPSVIYAGRLIVEKRIDLLIAALATLPDVELTIFGEGPEMTNLRRLAAASGVESRCRFRGHVLDSAEVWRSIRRAAIAVQPSSREGFGLFPLESMAIGVPVVYCDSEDSAVREIVRDGIEGVCAAPHAASLANAIDDLLRNDDRRRSLGANGTVRARQFDWQKITAEFESVLETLVQRSRTVQPAALSSIPETAEPLCQDRPVEIRTMPG